MERVILLAFVIAILGLIGLKWAISWGERRQLLYVLVIVSAIAVSCLIKPVPPLSVDYKAKIVIDGNLSLDESYVYHVRDNYRMLYRSWLVPLTVGEWIDMPHVELLKAEGDATAYAKDYKGRVFLWGKSEVYDTVRRLAEVNEVGIISLPRFTKGDHSAHFVFLLFPPVESDGRYDHVNLMLANKHVEYDHVDITVVDPNGAIVRLYPHMDSFKVERIGNGWRIVGSSPKDGLVEVEMVLKHGYVHGFLHHVDDVLGKTDRANLFYKVESEAMWVSKVILTAIALSFPAMVVIIYLRYGRERSFVVPEYLSYVPKKMRPWLVNLLFKGDAFSMDEDALYATMLDLMRKGKIEMERKDGKLVVKVIDENSEDGYERRVLKFLKEFSVDGVFDTSVLKEVLSRDRLLAHRYLNAYASLSNTTFVESRVAERYVDKRGRWIFAKLAMVFVMLAVVLAFFNVELAMLAAIPFLQSIVCFAMPTQLFGRWRGESYKEKLEWDAFRRFLSDMAMMKKYEPEDIVIWKDWLVYGTALGVGEKVVKAMKEMGVEVPEMHVYVGMGEFRGLRTTASSAVRPSGGSFATGGGFGAGGGFGGGGAGGR